MVTVEATTRDEWYDEASGFADFGYRHAWDFQLHSARRQGTVAEHVKICSEDEVLGLAGVRIKPVPVIGSGVAYVGGGPLTRRNQRDDVDRLSSCLRALTEEYVGSRDLVLRVAPPVVAPDLVDAVAGAYAAAGFVPTTAVARYRTLMLDLSPDVDELRANFARRWRRDLSRSQKSEWDVSIGSGSRELAEFRELFERFVDWKSFDVEHDARFHEEVHADLPESARYLVVLARFEGELAGGIVVTRTGDTAVYMLGAMNPDLRKKAPGYELQWRSIQHMKQLGFRWYDTGGIDPDGNEGVYRFKSGMADVDISAPGPYEHRPGALRAGLVALAERTHARLRRIRT